MRKVDRQQLIKQLITQNEIETQDELIALLEREGVKATQATVSRDVREMSIVKTHGSNGHVKYALFSQTKSTSSEEKLRESVKDSVIRMERVQFMIVVHTDMGAADVVTNFLDEVNYQEIAGTVAGVDTIIIIARSEEEAQVVVDRFEAMMK
ncbi:arginine repressor [Enterococcus sp. LJL99]